MRRPESPTLRVLTFLAAIEEYGGSFLAREGSGLFRTECLKTVRYDVQSLLRSGFLTTEWNSGKYQLTDKGREALREAREALGVVA